MSGTVYLVPNLLGVAPPETALPARTLDVARRLRHWRVETPKSARAFLKTLALATPIATLDVVALPASPTAADGAALLAPALAGDDVGVLSDAGCPGVADPGAALVGAAHAAGLRVVPLVGPSAILLALMASGMNGQRFAFHGYLPVKPEARAAALRALEQDSRREQRAHLFIETPYRNVALIEAFVATCQPATRLCVAVDLTTPTESIVSLAIRDWGARDHGDYAKRPAMFVLQA